MVDLIGGEADECETSLAGASAWTPVLALTQT